MADQKISELTALTGANVADDDAIAIVDTSATETKKIVFSELKNALDTATGFVRITGDTMTGNLSMGDNVKAIFGAGSDLQIYHNGSHSYIQDVGTGRLYITTNGDEIRLTPQSGGENGLRVQQDGAVNLYYDNAEKFATTSAGVDITGTVTADQFHHEGSQGVLLSAGSGTDTTVLENGWTSGIGDWVTLQVPSVDDEGGLMRLGSNGNFYLYEDTGSTPKFFWDASAESLGLGTTSPDRAIKIHKDNAYVWIADAAGGNVGFLGGSGANDGLVRLYEGTGHTAKVEIHSNADSYFNGGNVGIGTNSPFDVFHVRVGTDKNLYFTDASSETGNVATIQGINNAGSSLASVGFRGTDIRFANQSSETMRIDNSGKVGIGTSSPTGKLSIASGTYNAATPLATADDIVISGNQSLGMSFITASAGSSNQTIVFGDSDNTDIGMIRYAHANNSMQFTTNTAEAMRIDSSGRVGIGTSSPSANLEIAQSGNNVGLLVSGGGYNYTAKFESSDAEANIIIEDSNSTNDGNMIGVATNDMYFITNTSEAMRITSSGSVGIGTSSPVASLDVIANSGAGCLSLRTRVNNDYSFLTFRSNDGTEDLGGSAIYRSAASTSNLLFYTANGGAATERMRIDSSGNLLVGQSTTTVPGVGNTTAGVSIRGGDGSFFSRSLGSGDTNNVVTINRSSNDGNILGFNKDGSTVGSIGVGSGRPHFVANDGSTGGGFKVDSTQFYPVDRVGTTSNGVLNLGATDARWKDLYLSGGVYLGGTGAANKLDDYEEGTWTPTAAQGITGLTVVKAIYTKVGRAVTVMAYLSSMSGKNSSHLQIGGLPFTPDTQHYSTGVLECGTSGQMGIVRTDANNTYVVFYKPASDNTRTNLVGNDVGSSHIIFSITYQTT